MADCSVIGRICCWFDEWFLWLLIGAYLFATIWPGPGLGLQRLESQPIHLFGNTTPISSGMVLLALLLFIAGLELDVSQLMGLRTRFCFVAIGVAANLCVPLACVLLVSPLQHLWHNSGDVQNILVGLALVVSMPIAGSSTAWSQKARGNLALSIGLVLLSSVCSPWTTPVAFRSIALVTTGEHSERLRQLSVETTGLFLLLCVIAPSAAGIGIRTLLSRESVARIWPYLRLANALVLLLLIYANTAISLPEAVRDFDVAFMTLTLAIVVALCAISFASGGLIAWLARSDSAERAAFVFGLGMNNNGSGLVLASLTLADFPRVMLPLILYNLVQHLGAGICERFWFPAKRRVATH